ncbi:MAG: hypothetical protein UZ21_OP11001000903 [Microgenomates bacterium OLB22]|nr:MAG: hypothetical protein UZ21_OP11001000903 [Microgenomates bacterium OLB22]
MLRHLPVLYEAATPVEAELTMWAMGLCLLIGICVLLIMPFGSTNPSDFEARMDKFVYAVGFGFVAAAVCLGFFGATNVLNFLGFILKVGIWAWISLFVPYVLVTRGRRWVGLYKTKSKSSR